MDKDTLSKLDKFFLDPDWPLVEAILLEYIEPLKYASNVDLKQPSEAVHAELKANLAAHSALERFLSDAGMLRSRKRKADFK